jgi:predicted AAA+ superfamily ATPase
MRYLADLIQKDLNKKMVLLGGPRQSGKTTLAQGLLDNFRSGLYLNYDRDRDQKILLSEGWSDTQELLIFDEIHKYPRWKNWVKGVYDTEKSIHKILVTGSARLNVYKKGGDSLMGRYHYWRLHPFSLSEHPKNLTKNEVFSRLMKVGGFPEPFLDGDEAAARRWRTTRLDSVIRDDIRDLENIKNIPTLALLVDLLRSRVGSLIVVSNIANDLHVTSATIVKWIAALERMYYIFVVRPFGTNVPRSIQKPFKVYFYDNAEVDGDDGAKFENLVATSLLKRLEFLEDSTGYRYQLCFLRDKEKREVDFVVLKEKKIEVLIEAKWADANPSPHLIHFAEKLNVPSALQILGRSVKNFKKGKFFLQSATESDWLNLL